MVIGAPSVAKFYSRNFQIHKNAIDAGAAAFDFARDQLLSLFAISVSLIVSAGLPLSSRSNPYALLMMIGAILCAIVTHRSTRGRL